MYHIEASINGQVRKFHYPMIKHNAVAIYVTAKNCFSHTRCDWVRICDNQGPVRYVSHSGEMYG